MSQVSRSRSPRLRVRPPAKLVTHAVGRVASARSRGATSNGVVDSHAGDASDQMTLRIKFVESKKTGVTDTALGSGSEWLSAMPKRWRKWRDRSPERWSRPTSHKRRVGKRASAGRRPNHRLGRHPRSYLQRESLIARDVQMQVLLPSYGVSVGRRPPVSSRRKRAAGRHFWAIGHCRTFKLTRGKKPLDEHTKPMADLS